MRKYLTLYWLVGFLSLGTMVWGYQDSLTITVNGKRLNPNTVRWLEQQYGTRAKSGHYWYDNFSGLLGIQGGPAFAKIAPGLRLGGPLRADASGGMSNVFVNGRALHPTEIANLRRCTQVVPGRYWVNAQGDGGVEGGPRQFNLYQLCQPAKKPDYWKAGRWWLAGPREQY